MDNKFIIGARDAAVNGIKKIEQAGSPTTIWSTNEIAAMYNTIIMLADELLKKSNR